MRTGSTPWPGLRTDSDSPPAPTTKRCNSGTLRAGDGSIPSRGTRTWSSPWPGLRTDSDSPPAPPTTPCGLWEASSGRLLNTLQEHENWVFSVAWAPDGQRLASGSRDNTVRLWTASSGRLLNTLQGHENWIRTVAWAPDGQRLASGSSDQHGAALGGLQSGRLLNTLQGHGNSVLTPWPGLRTDSDSPPAPEDNTVRLWNLVSGKKLHMIKVANPTWIAWTSGDRLAISSSRGFIEIWDVKATPRLLVRLYQVPGTTGFAATPDGYVPVLPKLSIRPLR